MIQRSPPSRRTSHLQRSGVTLFDTQASVEDTKRQVLAAINRLENRMSHAHHKLDILIDDVGAVLYGQPDAVRSA